MFRTIYFYSSSMKFKNIGNLRDITGILLNKFFYQYQYVKIYGSRTNHFRVKTKFWTFDLENKCQGHSWFG